MGGGHTKKGKIEGETEFRGGGKKDEEVGLGLLSVILKPAKVIFFLMFFSEMLGIKHQHALVWVGISR